jgi:hypothetical protein
VVAEKLRGCLPRLPAQLQTILRLRTGIDGSRPQSLRSTARLLRISPRRVLTSEIAAMRLLRVAAETTGCAMTAARPASWFVSLDYFAGVAPPGAGGVAGALYLRPVAQPEAVSPTSGATVGSPTAGGSALSGSSVPVILVLAVAVLMALALVRAESLGGRPRRRRRRSR